MGLPPVLAGIIGLLLLAWLVLLILVPFMIEGIRTWTRRNHEELRALNQRIDRLSAALEARREIRSERPAPAPAEPSVGRADRGAAPRMPAGRPPATRREPTLSELPVEAGQDRRPGRMP